MPLLIDGYNLLRFIQRDETFASLDEAGLVRILSEYLDRIRDRAQIIFDGTGPRDKSALGGFRNLEVFFSGKDIEADEIIEQKIEDNSAPRSLIVVSSDRQLVSASRKRKAVSAGAELFWLTVIKMLERERPIPEPKEKRQGITDAETDQWMNYFGFDKQ